MGQQKDWCSRRSTQVNTGYYLGQSSYLGRNNDIELEEPLVKVKNVIQQFVLKWT